MEFPFTTRPRKFTYPETLGIYYVLPTIIYGHFRVHYQLSKKARDNSGSVSMSKRKNTFSFMPYACVWLCVCVCLRGYVTWPQDRFHFCGFHLHIASYNHFLLPINVSFLFPFNVLSTRRNEKANVKSPNLFDWQLPFVVNQLWLFSINEVILSILRYLDYGKQGKEFT